MSTFYNFTQVQLEIFKINNVHWQMCQNQMEHLNRRKGY